VCFFIGRHFYPSLKFASKTVAYPRGAPFRAKRCKLFNGMLRTTPFGYGSSVCLFIALRDAPLGLAPSRMASIDLAPKVAACDEPLMQMCKLHFKKL
jgi:hypothetical protein